MKRALWILLLASCGRPPAELAPVLPFPDLGAFEHKEKAPLPANVTAWNGKRVRATGFLNPGRQVRGLSQFYLVKDRSSCCFGARPQINHYIDVGLKGGATTDYTTDPVTVQGVLVVEERFDGDWPTGLYWMKDAELLR